MSTGTVIKKEICKIGKKADKSDCSKKGCEHCRHWVVKEFWKDACTGIEYPVKDF